MQEHNGKTPATSVTSTEFTSSCPEEFTSSIKLADAGACLACLKSNIDIIYYAGVV
jgi:hypothetical protein